MREHTSAPPKYSVVVPLHDEQESIRELHERLSDVMTGRYEPVEIILFVPPGLLGISAGGAILLALFFDRVFMYVGISAEHGPLRILGMMLCLFGVQVLAVGWVGEALRRLKNSKYFHPCRPEIRFERLFGRLVSGLRANYPRTL
jgi:hypothetical protein